VEHGVGHYPIRDPARRLYQPVQCLLDGFHLRDLERWFPGGRFTHADGFQPQPKIHQVVDRLRVEIEHQVDGGGDRRFGATQGIGARAAADVD
jgi:hypothetical protein